MVNGKKKAKYVRSSEINKTYKVHYGTIYSWAKKGKIGYITSKSGKNLYNLEDIERYIGTKDENGQEEGETIIYVRVSSHKQKEDLERQEDYIKERVRGQYRVIKDIGSGLNYKRRGYCNLLKSIMEGNVSRVVVTYRDRISRFGYEVFEQICQFNETEIVVLNQQDQSSEEEFKDDLISICTYFAAKSHGSRKYGKNKKDKIEIDKSSEEDIVYMDEGIQEDIQLNC